VTEHHRPIRSFVKRQGRMTQGQSRALEACLPEFGVELHHGEINFAELFQRKAPNIIEIGFGMGQSLVTQAENQPECNFLGIEVHLPGVGSLLNSMQDKGLSNLRVSCDDAVEVINQQITPESAHGIQVFFPDPWHKKRHNKRRLIQPQFVQLLASRLAPGGFLHLATDWQPYAEHMLEVLSAEPTLVNTSETNDYVPRPESRPETKFEKRGHRLGHGVWDLFFIRNS